MRLENLRESYLHDMSIYGRDAWLAKHRRYAAAEALAVVTGAADAPWRRLLSPDPLARRRALKRLSLALPFRPALRFAYQYGLRLGFLDGRQGLRYCLSASQYEGFIADEIRQAHATAQLALRTSTNIAGLPFCCSAPTSSRSCWSSTS